jgi:hypothetical protein
MYPFSESLTIEWLKSFADGSGPIRGIGLNEFSDLKRLFQACGKLA